jgi:mannose-6-phosphate isomerase-like protein (cupin superfamily)
MSWRNGVSNEAEPKFRNYQAPVHSVVDWNEGPTARAMKGWGREDWLLNDAESNMCVKILTLESRKACSFHFHIKKSEIFFIISGDMDFEWKDTETGHNQQMALRPGDSVYVPPGCPHRFSTINERGCVFLEASTFHEDSDSYRIAPGDSQNGPVDSDPGSA